MMTWFSRLFCRHHDLEFVQNLYGDQIIEWGWKRSIWRCTKCEKRIARDELHAERPAEGGSK